MSEKLPFDSDRDWELSQSDGILWFAISANSGPRQWEITGEVTEDFIKNLKAFTRAAQTALQKPKVPSRKKDSHTAKNPQVKGV